MLLNSHLNQNCLKSGLCSVKVDKCISVEIPFFNGNKYIEETIDSLELNRDYISEVIICVDKYSENVMLKKNYSFQLKLFPISLKRVEQV